MRGTPGPSPPASGLALMETLIRIEGKLDEFIAAAEAHWAREEERMHLVDQFVDPNIDLVGTLAVLREALVLQRETLNKLDKAVREGQKTVHTAMQLRLGAKGLEREGHKHEAKS